MNTKPLPDLPAPPRLGFGLMAVAVLSTLLASTCCVLPLVLVLLGVTGAWMANLAILKPLTLPLSLLAIAALAWAGYLVFRSAPGTACDARQTCANGTPFMRRLFIACALLVGTLLLFPFIAPLLY